MKDDDTLESWKEISAYLKRSVKTCRHWAKDLGLPVHRLEDSPKAHVFASKEEMAHWKAEVLNSKKSKLDPHKMALYGGAIIVLALFIYSGIKMFRTNKFALSSIAILPFENVNADPDADYLCEGLTESVINKIARLSKLKTVISRNSVFQYKGKRIDAKTVGRELSVDVVLLTRLIRDKDELLLSTTLVRTKDDSQLWGERYKRKFEDIFALEEEIAGSVVQALQLKLTPSEERRMAERPIGDVRAYQWYLRAMKEFDRFTEDALNNALSYLQKSLDIVGDNALLYSGMASVYLHQANIGVKQEENVARAEEYVRKALALDPDCPQAHAVLGHILSQVRGNQTESIHHLKKALSINPDDPDVLLRLCMVYAEYAGRISTAHPLYEKFIQINPLFPARHLYRGVLFFYDGKFSPALELFRNAHQLNPEDPAPQNFYAWCLFYCHQPDEAISIIDKSIKMSSDNSYVKFGRMLKYAWLKDKQKSLQEMTPDFIEICNRDAAWSHSIADALALLGAKEEAIDWLENAVDKGFINYPFLSEKDPLLESIRGELRFIKLMERVKYEWEDFKEQPSTD